MTADEVVEGIDVALNPQMGALFAFRAIVNFTDGEMADGDAARRVAEAWLARFDPVGRE